MSCFFYHAKTDNSESDARTTLSAPMHFQGRMQDVFFGGGGGGGKGEGCVCVQLRSTRKKVWPSFGPMLKSLHRGPPKGVGIRTQDPLLDPHL